MRRTLVWAVVAIAGLLAAAVAYGGSTATYEATATGSKKAGTEKNPKPFKGSWHNVVSEPGGARGPSPETWSWSWEGVKFNGKKFPTCTAQQIDQVQSNSVCPKKSLLAEAPFTAKLGPEGDPNSNVECTGKTVNMYNAGKKTIVWLIVGPPEGCAGLTYLPPFEGTVKTKKTKVASAAKKKGKKKAATSTTTVAFPDNITSPLPGIAGALNEMTATFLKRTKKVKGKKVSLLESTGCKGQRDFKFVTRDSEGTHTTETTAGKCKK